MDNTIKRKWCIMVDKMPNSCEECMYYGSTLQKSEKKAPAGETIFDMVETCNLTGDINLGCPLIENPILIKELETIDYYSDKIINEV